MTAVVLLLGLGLANLAGPGPTGAPPEGAEAAPPAERYGAPSSGGTFWVEWWPDPAPLPFNQVFAIHFRVLDPSDRETLVAGAVVTADAWMPDHNHGTTLVPRVESHGDGTATGEGFLLAMEGRWELRVGVAADGRMERAVFPLDLEP